MPASIVDLNDLNPTPVPPQVRLLLVEDEVIVAQDVRRRLENLGYTVLGIATRGKEAIEMAVSLQPHLILMDIGLRGGMDGIETVRRIREKLDVPVIFASAYSDDTTLQRARTAGPQGFVLKPFEERELRLAIEMALYKHAADKLLRDNESLFRRVCAALPDGVLLEDAGRKVKHANVSFFRIFNIPDSISLTGKDTRAEISHEQKLIKDHAGFLRRKEEILNAGVPVTDEAVLTTDGRTILLSYAPIEDLKNGTIHLWQYHVAGRR
jgi:two-component system, response regulator PdtaR